MIAITIDEAQKELPNLIKRALAGEDIVIAGENHQPAVRLSALAPGFNEATAEKRGYGSWAGKFEVSERFFDPLADEECGYGADPK